MLRCNKWIALRFISFTSIGSHVIAITDYRTDQVIAFPKRRLYQYEQQVSSCRTWHEHCL